MLDQKYTVDVGEESYESNDDDARGIRFSDSEEDKANEINEGLTVIEVMDRTT